MLRLLIPVGLLFIIDLYFFQVVRTLSLDLGVRTRTVVHILYWTLNVALFIGMLWMLFHRNLPDHYRQYFFSFFLVLFVPKLLGSMFLIGEDIFRVTEGLITLSSSEGQPSLSDRRKFVSQIGVSLAAIPFATMIYGMVKTAFNLQVKKMTVTLDDLPESFNGLRIAQISDLHSGSFASSEFIAEAVDRIVELDADLVFFTGDLVNNEAREAVPHLEQFKRLRAKSGVYSILGNHDYGDYGPWPTSQAKAANLKHLKEIHHEAGWNLLLNDHHILEKNGDKLAIVGVENWGASKHFPKYGDLHKAVAGAEHIPFKILLSHDPSHWDAKIKTHPQKFQLTLSGHTHGAQFGIEIPGFRWSPVQYIYKQWAGLYEEAGQNLYVNRGLGFIGYMGRIGISPEITLLELRSSKNV